ncbi:MAG: DUF6804 family protein [Candidatus Paceibacterota bacterium]
MKKIVTIIAIVLLFGAIRDGLAYDYFTFLRFVVCASSIYLAVFSSKQNLESWMWTFIITAILFNPVLKVTFSRDTWVLIDLITGAIFTSSIFLIKETK